MFKIKNKYKILIASILCSSPFVNSLNSKAEITTVPYITNPDSQSFADLYESPSAYKIYGAESTYGFKDGTIMYKQSYEDIIYYSPKPPNNSAQASSESSQYKDWGFWDFIKNQEHQDWIKSGTLFRANVYFKEAKLKNDAYVYGCNEKGSPLSTGQKVAKGTKLKVKSITITNVSGVGNVTYVYFDISGVKDVNGRNITSFNNIARIKYSDVTKSSTEATKQIYFQEMEDYRAIKASSSSTSAQKNEATKCIKYYDNFKAYATDGKAYQGSSHDTLRTAKTTVPSTVNYCKLAGKTGEWKHLGLSSKGNVVLNPYYPSDAPAYLGNGNSGYYDWRYTPWNSSDASTQEKNTNTTSELRTYANAFVDQYDAPTSYDGSSYNSKKIDILQSVLNDGITLSNTDSYFSNNKSATHWANCLSLQTHPTYETPVFVGQRRFQGNYSQNFSVLQKANDLYIAEVQITKPNGEVVLTGKRNSYNSDFTYDTSVRLKRGLSYNVKVKVGKRANPEIKANKVSVVVDVLSQEKNIITVKTNNKLILNNKGGLTNNNNISDVLTFGFSVPATYKGDYYEVRASIGEEHNGIDNLDFSNDKGIMFLRYEPYHEPPVRTGDVTPTSIELLENNTVVYRLKYGSSTPEIQNAIIPGKKYKIRYNAIYQGDRWDTNTFIENQGWEVTRKQINFPLSYSITRKASSTMSDDSTSNNVLFVDSSGNTNIPVESEVKLSYTTEEIMFEHPYLDTTFNIKVEEKRVNDNTNNDSLSATINDTFDISISNLKVLPMKEYVGDGINKVTYSVVYDATLTVPSYARNDYNSLTETSFIIGGNSFIRQDFLQPGINRNITHTFEDISVVGGSTTSVSVVLNHNKASYESGDFSNNGGRTEADVVKIRNPFSGSVNDKASPANNSNNNSSPNRGGDANNNCLVPRTKNAWTSSYNVTNWGANDYSYRSFAGNRNINFKTYNVTSKETVTKDNTENFSITSVMIRSKYTKSNNLGDNGWVDITNDSTHALVKAGYGFELKVTVRYSTNALVNNPTWTTNTNSGTFVTGVNSTPYLNPELFIEIPGKNSSGKVLTILSTTGYSGTTQGINVNKTQNNVLSSDRRSNISEWVYTLKPTSSSGVSETGKIYIPGNLKDGDYKLSIYTSPVTGVSSTYLDNTSKYSALCDRKDVTIKVNGSATDDLLNHTTQ